MKMNRSVLAMTLFLVVATTRADEQPNMVFFVADDVSQEDIGCYGHLTVRTPSIDA
jgi:arylsulfatase